MTRILWVPWIHSLMRLSGRHIRVWIRSKLGFQPILNGGIESSSDPAFPGILNLEVSLPVHSIIRIMIAKAPLWWREKKTGFITRWGIAIFFKVNPFLHFRDGEIYNLGSAVGTSVNTIYETLAKLLDVPGSAEYAPARKGEIERTYLDASKAKEELGWTPEVSFEEGLGRTIDYFKEHRERL